MEFSEDADMIGSKGINIPFGAFSFIPAKKHFDPQEQ